MNGIQFTQWSHIAALVRKYQDRWQFCLDRKMHSYYWLEEFAQQH
jgi:hypothetical protein